MKSAQYFYDSIFPSLVMSVLLGISPIFIKTHGNYKILCTTKCLYFINILYTIIFFILVLRTVSETRSNVMSNSYYGQNKVSNIGISFVFISGIIYVFIIYICGLFRTESIKQTLERFAKIDRKLEKLGQQFEYNKSIIYQIATQFAAIVVICFITAVQYVNIHLEHFRVLSNTTWVVFIFPAVVVNVFENQFTYTILLIFQRFRMINQRLKSIAVSPSSGKKYSILNFIYFLDLL